MGSEAFGPLAGPALGPEAAGLLAAVFAAFAGAAIAASVKAIIRRDGASARRSSIAAMVLGSLALVPAVPFAVQAIIDGGIPQGAWAYAAVGLTAGALAGAFPSAAGAPLAAAAALAALWGMAAAAGTIPWRDGDEVARLVVFSAAADATICAVDGPGKGGAVIERDLRLPPGPIAFELRVVTAEGPFRALLGPRRYRLDAILAGAERIEWPPGEPRRRNVTAPSFMGIRADASATSRAAPDDHATLTLRLISGGAASVETR